MTRRLSLALAVALTALAALGVGTGLAKDEFHGYTRPGEWFSPGEMYSGFYDWCGFWKENVFSKGSGAYGLITFIDLSGRWHYGKQGLGVLTRQLSFAERRAFVKKPHCRNSSSATYQGGCFAIIEIAQCA